MIRILKKDCNIYEPEGYGNELGLLMNPTSSYYAFQPEMTFFIIDLFELMEHDLSVLETADNRYVDDWFQIFEQTINQNQTYFIADSYLFGPEVQLLSSMEKLNIERQWNNRLLEIVEKYKNIYIFPYHRLLEQIGESQGFSNKMWYLGKILHSNEAQKRIAEEILFYTTLPNRVTKKVLLLDLDNTLWGGLAGERDHQEIILSEDHNGLIYKNLQRLIKRMRKEGVLLGIVSKNNVEDVTPILNNHPHMVLKEDDFVVQKVNWLPKYENIIEIAKELTLGLDSIVFFDDNESARELVLIMLPDVFLPPFPIP